MNKLNIKFIVILLMALHEGSALADSGRLGGGFFSFGNNNVEGGNASTREIMRQKQAKKNASVNIEKRPGANRVEQGKGLNAQNSENSNLAPKKNRMTPEERRALRRQIHDASTDVYVSPK